jgi:magnesium transporter
MAHHIKKSKSEIGISPYAFVFRGEQKVKDILLRLIDFDAETLSESVIDSVAKAAKYQEKNSVTWFNVDGLHNTKLMQEISKEFKLDPLILADVLNVNARPTMKVYNNCIFISLRMLQSEEGSDKILSENLSLILTKSVLFTFQERKGDVFEPVRDRIRAQNGRIRKSGTDYLLFALLDIVIDHYIYLVSVLGEKIEELEDQLLAEPTQEVVETINRYKRELNFLRRSIKPAKEMIFAVLKLDTGLITEETAIHYHELRDNVNQANESSDHYREILSDQLNIYHTTISGKLNDIMKFLTVFSVVFIPLTFIAGIYGTNFDFVPELHLKYGYFIMWGVFVVLTVAMLLYFKNKKWL